MRIYLAVRHSLEPSEYFGDLWSKNFIPALRSLGHEVVESSVDLLPTSRFMHVGSGFTSEERAVRDCVTEAIVDEVTAAHRIKPFDLALTYLYNAHVTPDGLARFRDLGIPTINFFCNGIYQFDLVRAIAPTVDYSWHPERDAAASYRAVGARPVWVQMAADPSVYRPVEGVSRRNAAVFVGQRYADRVRWLAAIAKANVDFDLFGSGWSGEWEPVNGGGGQTPYLGRSVARPGSFRSYLAAMQAHVHGLGWGRGLLSVIRRARYRRESRTLLPVLQPHYRGRAKDIATTFSGYAVVLNFGNVWQDGRPGSRLVPHVRLRDFEAPMARSCYLTGYCSELEEFYELGKEVDTYRTEAELVDKTRYYLGNVEAAERLRAAAHRRASADHTWTQRFRQLFAATGLA